MNAHTPITIDPAAARDAYEEIAARAEQIRHLANVTASWSEQVEHAPVRAGIHALMQSIEAAISQIEGELPAIWSGLGGK